MVFEIEDMMVKKVLVVFLLMIAVTATAFAEEWKIDKTHSSVSFKVRHMVISKVKGGFDDFSGTIDDTWGNKRAGFSASTTINRQDFKVSFSKVLDNGGLMVGNDVEIDIELEIIQVKEDKK